MLSTSSRLSRICFYSFLLFPTVGAHVKLVLIDGKQILLVSFSEPGYYGHKNCGAIPIPIDYGVGRFTTPTSLPWSICCQFLLTAETEVSDAHMIFHGPSAACAVNIVPPPSWVSYVLLRRDERFRHRHHAYRGIRGSGARLSSPDPFFVVSAEAPVRKRQNVRHTRGPALFHPALDAWRCYASSF